MYLFSTALQKVVALQFMYKLLLFYDLISLPLRKLDLHYIYITILPSLYLMIKI